MKSAPVDRRTEKTKRQLKDVLIGLLQTRSLKSISIQEITRMADISRGTFYLHYRDIFDLYQAIEDDVVEDVAEIVARPSVVRNEDDLDHMLSAIFGYMSQNINACEALLRTDSATFLAHVFERNRPTSKETWDTLFGMDDVERGYSYVFISYGFAGMLKHWMDSGKHEAPPRIAAIVKRLLNGYLITEAEKKP